MGIAVKYRLLKDRSTCFLHLIEKNKVSIYDIPIAEITDQYMAYLHEMKKQDLGVMSEFLLMAATLLDIKSRMLLPKEVNEEGEEEDPRQDWCSSCSNIRCINIFLMNLRNAGRMPPRFSTISRICRKK